MNFRDIPDIMLRKKTAKAFADSGYNKVSTSDRWYSEKTGNIHQELQKVGWETKRLAFGRAIHTHPSGHKLVQNIYPSLHGTETSFGWIPKNEEI